MLITLVVLDFLEKEEAPLQKALQKRLKASIKWIWEVGMYSVDL